MIPDAIEIVNTQNVYGYGVESTKLLHELGFFDPSIRYRMSKMYSFVARMKESHEMVGLLLARPDTENGTQCTYIEQLVVKPEWQHQGIGSELLQRFVMTYGILMDIRLDYFEESLENFYNRFGFVLHSLQLHTVKNEAPELRHCMKFQRFADRLPNIFHV